MSLTFNYTSTDTSVTIDCTDDNLSVLGKYIEYSVNGTTVQSETYYAHATMPISTVISNLTPNTTYTVHWTEYDGGADTSTGNFTVKTKSAGYNDPKVATEGQWEDLASRIKALDARITALENA